MRLDVLRPFVTLAKVTGLLFFSLLLGTVANGAGGKNKGMRDNFHRSQSLPLLPGRPDPEAVTERPSFGSELVQGRQSVSLHTFIHSLSKLSVKTRSCTKSWSDESGSEEAVVNFDETSGRNVSIEREPQPQVRRSGVMVPVRPAPAGQSAHPKCRKQVSDDQEEWQAEAPSHHINKRVPIGRIRKWVDIDNSKSPLSKYYPPGLQGTPLSFQAVFFTDLEKRFLSDKAALVLLGANCGSAEEAGIFFHRARQKLFLVEHLLPNMRRLLGGVCHFKGINFQKNKKRESWLKSALQIADLLYNSPLDRFITANWEKQKSELLKLKSKIIEKQERLQEKDSSVHDALKKDTLHIAKLLDDRIIHLQIFKEADYRTYGFIEESTAPLRLAVDDLVDQSISPSSTPHSGLVPSRLVSVSKSSIASSKSSDSDSGSLNRQVVIEKSKRVKLQREADTYYSMLRLPVSANVSCPQAKIGEYTRQILTLMKHYGISRTVLKSFYEERLSQVQWDPIIKRVRVPYGLDSLDVESRIIPAHRLGIGGYEAGQGIASVFRCESEHACNLNRSELYIKTQDKYYPAFIGLHSAGCCSFGIEDRTVRLQANLNRAREVLKASALRYMEIKPYKPGIHEYYDVPVMIISLLTPDFMRRAAHMSRLVDFSQDERVMLDESFGAFEAVAEEARSGFTLSIGGRDVILNVNFQLVFFSFGVNELSKGTVGAIVGAQRKADGINTRGMKKMFVDGLFETQLGLFPGKRVRNQAMRLREYIQNMYSENIHEGAMEQSYVLPEALLNLAYTLNIIPYWFCKSGTDRTLDCGINVRRFACDMAFGLIGANDHPFSKECYKTLFMFSGTQELQARCRGTSGFKSKTMFGKHCPSMAKESDYIPAMYK